MDFPAARIFGLTNPLHTTQEVPGMRKSIAVAAMGAALIVSPTAATADTNNENANAGKSARHDHAVEKLVKTEPISKPDIYSGLDDTKLDPVPVERYLDVRQKFTKRFGKNEAGRDIVRDGFKADGGQVVAAPSEELAESTDRMQTALNPPEPEPVATDSGATASTAAVPSAAADTATVACESGGDYSAKERSAGVRTQKGQRCTRSDRGRAMLIASWSSSTRARSIRASLILRSSHGRSSWPRTEQRSVQSNSSKRLGGLTTCLR